MSEKKVKRGTFPTMITPYNEDGSVDYGAVRALTEWYWKEGCSGIFASCQSSEIWYLPEKDRIHLAAVVKETANRLAKEDSSREPMTIVASGHVSDNFADQSRELNLMAQTGVDAVILITNRMDQANTGEDNWIRETEALVNTLPASTLLGLYECPHPTKRLLTPKMLRYAADHDRFRFIKDTCCDAQLIEERLHILEGSNLLLYNANAQTLYPSLLAGGGGYCGIMCNFHPRLYQWLMDHLDSDPERAAQVAQICSMTAFTESLAYPITAKYHLRELEHLPIHLYTKARNADDFTPYHAMCIRQMDALIREVLRRLDG